MTATAILLKQKKDREEKRKEEEKREAEGAEDFLVGAERVDQFELLYQHEDEVFGDLDINDGENADYTWFDEDHSSFYLVPYAEGVCSLPLPGCWASVCAAFVRLARNPQFDNLVNGTIGLVAVAFTMHIIDSPDLGHPHRAGLGFFVRFVKTCSMVVFAAEMGVKILAEGSRPLRYWTGPESSINTFDSSIVVLSFALMGAHGAGEAILPVLRLARLIKLLNRSAETRRVLYGIIAGFKAMASIVVLLGLIMFLYAIIGVKSFGENDPAHFGTVPIAMLTLFVASTCSDWSHMLQINYKGCDKGGGDWGYERADRLTQFETMVGRFYNYDCHDPTPRKLDAILFFYSYTMLTAFVVLNLFISAIDMAMFDILYADQVEAHEDHIEADPNHEPPPIVDSSKIAARRGGGGGDARG
ncbi:low voltage-gated calcium channel [Aureococcus anophagefferens]|uniref:Low voltage-gated calcium channel n=1 Tax=Aureococcus anophagefferens TaxID=44056 RepID=A0ABR1FML1_AURAN